jgi:hypothetical protein
VVPVASRTLQNRVKSALLSSMCLGSGSIMCFGERIHANGQSRKVDHKRVLCFLFLDHRATDLVFCAGPTSGHTAAAAASCSPLKPSRVFTDIS